MEKLTWNEFLTACKEAWALEGSGDVRIEMVRSCLLRCGKTPRMSLTQVAAAAYRLYKADRKEADKKKDFGGLEWNVHY